MFHFRLWLAAGILLWNAVPLPAACRVKTAVVTTGIAVPVGVPVAPYSAYWFGASASQYGQQGSQQAPSGVSGIDYDLLAAKVAERLGGPRAASNVAVVQHCGKCHSGPEAKKGLDLTDLSAVSCEDRLFAISQVIGEKMPRDHKLTPEQAGKVIEQLSLPVSRSAVREHTPRPELPAPPPPRRHRPAGPSPLPSEEYQEELEQLSRPSRLRGGEHESPPEPQEEEFQ